MPETEILVPPRVSRTIDLFEDGSVTIADAAALLGITPQAVRLWVDKGAPLAHKGGKGRYNASRIRLRDLQEWHADTAREDAGARMERAYDLDAEKARKTAFEADLAEIKARRAIGEMISIDTAATIFDMQLGEIVAGMSALPSRVSTRLSVISDAREIRDILTREIVAIREQISEPADMAAKARDANAMTREDDDEDA